MSRRVQTRRSTTAPMDFEFTSRHSSSVKPVCGGSDEELNPPRKGPLDDPKPPEPPFPASSSTSIFSENRGLPFIFQTRPTQPPTDYPWAPPASLSFQKVIPRTPIQDVPKDVDMSELSPEKSEEKEDGGGRVVATGALRRIYKSRIARDKRFLTLARNPEDTSSNSDASDVGEQHDSRAISTTSNHYTLNMPSVPHPKSDMPYVLLGYLQFFFNLSLVLVFLYLVLQFILTVQRVVEQRMSEYSMGTMQEIALCASHYVDNLCGSNPVPALQELCATWATCMTRDPRGAQFGAELIAEVVNGFVEPISWKTLAFIVSSLLFLTVIVNKLLSLYPSRHHAPAHPVYPLTPFPPPFQGYTPAGPARSNSAWRGKGESDPEEVPRRRRLGG